MKWSMEKNNFWEKWLFLLFAPADLIWGEVSLQILLHFLLSEA